jgi:hypothetical protein
MQMPELATARRGTLCLAAFALPALLLAGKALGLSRPASPGTGLQEPPVEQEPPPVPPAPPDSPRAALALKQAELSQSIQGLWNLVRFEHATDPAPPANLAGLLSIDRHVLTFMCHIQLLEGTIFDNLRQFQGGVHHWRISDELRLQTASLLSHTNMNGKLEFEPQDTLREYELEIDLLGTGLVLVRPDRSRLYFERVPEPFFPERAVEKFDTLRSGLTPPGSVR